MQKMLHHDKIKHILVVRFNKVGDMLCTVPLLKTLRQNFKNAQITVLTEGLAQDIFSDNSLSDYVLNYRKECKHHFLSNRYASIWKRLSEHKKNIRAQFDISFAVKGGFSSLLAASSYISGAKTRAGYISSSGHIFNSFFNAPVEPIEFEQIHQVDAVLHLLSPFGINNVIKDVSIPVPDSYRETALTYLSKLGLTPKRKIAILNLSNNRKTSLWPLENYIQLAKILIDNYKFHCITTCTAEDKHSAYEVGAALGIACTHYPTPKLMDFAAIVSLADFILTGDGGAAHMGAAVKTRVVALFGDTSPVIWKPYGNQHIIIPAQNNDVFNITVDVVLNNLSPVLP